MILKYPLLQGLKLFCTSKKKVDFWCFTPVTAWMLGCTFSFRRRMTGLFRMGQPGTRSIGFLLWVDWDRCDEGIGKCGCCMTCIFCPSRITVKPDNVTDTTDGHNQVLMIYLLCSHVYASSFHLHSYDCASCLQPLLQYERASNETVT